MSKQKICFIAQFPPPIHGLSKAVETLYRSEFQSNFEFEKINITNNKDFLKNLNLIRKSQADLFYFTISQTKGGNLRDLFIFKLLAMQHKKCLIHLHGGYYRKLIDNDIPFWQRRANYKAIKRLEGAIVLGSSLKSIFQGMLPEENIYIVPNCIDNEYLMDFNEFQKKTISFSKRKEKHILYLSNFIRSKGYIEVLEMAKWQKKQVINGEKKKFYFDFAGKFFNEEEKNFFFKIIKNNGLEDYVTYHGVVNGDKKKELLKSCDIFILLTRYLNEGQPISILEAMGNGMLVVTTDHAGIPDIIKDKKNGIVIKCDVLEQKSNIQDIMNRILQIKEEDAVNMINEAYMQICTKYLEKEYLNNMHMYFKTLSKR